jgi:N-acetylglucosaminyl-diphospho-decaprenol L-rhamnosyltransferase
VVSYEAVQTVIDCVRSVREAAGEAAVEIVLVDNASPEHIAEAVEAAAPPVRVVRNEGNRGFPSAANQGMRAVDSEFVLLINPDARVIAGTLEGLLKVARDRGEAGAIGALVRNPDGSIYPSARKVPSFAEGLVHTTIGFVRPGNRWTRAYKLLDWDRTSERRVEWVSGSSMLLRRRALDQVGLFDEGYFMYVEDMDLCTRLRAAGWDVWFSPELEIEHVGGTATAGKKRMTLEHSRSIYRYFVKFHSHGWRVSLRPFAWVALRSRAAYVSWRSGER